jgi:hypothetical protein
MHVSRSIIYFIHSLRHLPIMCCETTYLFGRYLVLLLNNHFYVIKDIQLDSLTPSRGLVPKQHYTVTRRMLQ